ncbi:MAG: bifunctional folylpolyglutamate synthase/dihydrofolate synthase, partial [Thermoleophilia bacterium]|nr:bifunctional folylpolyglutamate synthase/dihydrofolate synthase [Thermoleophilia bacterium]
MAMQRETPVGEAFLLAREQFGMRFGLDRMRRLLGALGDPQDAFAGVHVVGTNGKSTTTLMIGAALRAQGLSVGCFTSPHLLSFRERLDVGGAPIEVDEFERAARAVREAAERLDAGAEADDRVTQFEAVTAVALVAFRSAGVDVAVVEAGLGGRLDATNVLGRSLVQVLTGVGIDHTEYLGDTIEAIAREKLAVVRSGAALVCGPLGEAAAIEANAISD